MDNLYKNIEWLKQSDSSSKTFFELIRFLVFLKLLNLEIIQLTTTSLDNNNGFILGNLDVSGFYRVNYDDINWNRIIQQLNNNKDVIMPNINSF